MNIPNLPEAIQTEELVLGVMLSDPDALDAIMALTAEDFALDRHRKIWHAAKWLHEHGQETDRNTVARLLIERGELESVGGLSYLVGLDSGLPRIYGLTTYLGTLRTTSTLRRAAIASFALSERLCQPGAGVEEVRAAEALLRDLAANAERKPPALQTLEELVGDIGLDEFIGGCRVPGIPTPWDGLNAILTGGGFRPGQVIVIAARPGMGKSATAAMIALAAAPYSPAIFSLEMSATECWHRILASHSSLPLKFISEGTLDRGGRDRVSEAIQSHKESIVIDDTPGTTVSAIMAAVKRRGAVGLVIIDYLQLMSAARKHQNRVAEISEITRALKIAARALKVPILVLSQLNRDPAKDDRAPELHDLKDSGSIEQDADVVMILHAKASEIKAAITEKRPSLLDLIVAKQRNGAQGRIRLRFFAGRMQMVEITELDMLKYI